MSNFNDDIFKEGDVDSFCNYLFNDRPKPENTISLEFDGIEIGQLFEELLYIFHNGMVKLYGNSENKINLDEISGNDFLKMYQYFLSFGIKLNYQKYKIDEEPTKEIIEKLNKKEKELLSDYFIPLKTDINVYILYFSI